VTKCVGGKEHGEVLTAADNPGEFDATVFGDEAPPVDYQYGYCRDCKQTMRWSVVSQRWVDWPGPLGSLPPLDDEELETLALVTQIYKDAMPDVMFPATRRAVGRRVLVLQSLLTAIAETRDDIYRESNKEAE
jgi:hypothetical protein